MNGRLEHKIKNAYYEGKKYAFAMDSYLEIPSGITQIKLVKTN